MKQKTRRYKMLGALTSHQLIVTLFSLITCVAIGFSVFAGTATTTVLISSPNPSKYGQDVTFTATVSPICDGGTVTFMDDGTTLGTVAVNTTTYKASLTTNTLSVGAHPITAAYSGTTNYDASTSSTLIQGIKRASKVTVFCSDTPLVVNDTATGTVTVIGIPENASTPPTGKVTLSHTGNGTLSPTSYTLQESDGGQFEFTYTPSDSVDSPHLIVAVYAGDPEYAGESDTFDQKIVKRAADIHMSIAPTTAYVLQPVAISIHVEDDTTAGTATIPTGTVSFDDGGKNGTFSNDTTTLNGSGDCTVTYTPAAFDAGTTTITATYTGSSVHASSSTTGHITVQLRPTQTTVSFDTSEGILVNESTGFTVTVKDIAGDGAAPPVGTIDITKSLAPTGEGVVGLTGGAPSGDHTEWTYSYVRTGLDAEGVDYDVVTAKYTPIDGIHTGSDGSYGKAISRRPTEMTLTGCTATTNGFQITAEVHEDSSNAGTATLPAGDFVTEEDSNNDQVLEETVVGTAPGPAVISKDTDLPIWNFTLKYKPNDRVHMASVASETCTKNITPPSGDGTTGANCTDGCGSGGTDVETMIWTLNEEIVSLHAVQMALDTASTIASLFPDPVWTAGIVFESGTEIPAKDIVIAIFDGFNIAIEVAITAMETDLDGDGIPDVIEENTTHTAYDNIDTDGDGMSDLDEIDNAGGYYGGTRRPDPNNWDSDGDGLGDGDEANTVGTSFCVQDTDCDGVTDYEEYTTYADYNSNTKGSTTARADTRDQCEPLVPDTDGDGLNDGVEYLSGKVDGVTIATPASTSDGDGGYSPFVNDDDSDGDGIPDGDESTNGDALWQGSLGGTGNGTASTGHGETHLCMADTDSDGLSDGEEVALFGSGNVDVITPYGSTDTNPALDTDSDDDGLSDYEEVNVTGTDPLNYDTDGDGIWDVNEFIATGGTWPHRSFQQISDPLDPDTDDDGLPDNIEYDGTGLGIGHGLGGSDDTVCPYVNDDDSDDDSLQDGHEDANHDGTITNTIGDTGSAGIGETSFCNPDTDGDGLSDGQEEGLFGQGTVTAHTASGDVTTVPALDVDSDDDGLSDYEEVNVTKTDPLNWDTDGDSLSDLNELIATGGTYPQRSFQQVSDPLDPDTDDDGLPDNIEYGGTGLGTSHGLGGSDDTVCPYVNDDDSDDDGLQDGVEDANHDGAWGESGTGGITIGRSDSQATKTVTYWETKPCVADTDGDGLLDGEEASLIGGGPVVGRPVPWPDVQPSPGFNTVIPEGVSLVLGEPGPDLDPTIPALDDDSDNDGLSDYEEVNITHTDPLDADSDNDTISDANELICTGGVWPQRTFDQESDPLDSDTDDDGLTDNIEWNGSGLGITRVTGGTRDLVCPYVNDDDSDDDGLQDGVEDANHDGTWGVNGSGCTIGSFTTQAAPASDGYYETDLCNPDTDGDGILDGEEVSQIGGGPVLGRPAAWPAQQPSPGFNTVTPEGRSTTLPVADYSGTGPLYTFTPTPGPALAPTVPALDVDSDNDGLSDYEELNTTGTDPLDADSDNDTIMDADELIATGGTPGDHPQRTFDQESDPLDINTDDDYLPDPVEGSCGDPVYTGTGLSQLNGALGGTRDTACPFVNNADSDDDGVNDGAVIPLTHVGPNGFTYHYVFIEGFHDVPAADVPAPGMVRTVVTPATGEQHDDSICNVCDSDSDGDGLTDGQEVGLGTNPQDWDTDDDGRSDWHEVTGGGPIPTDPFDPDTDDDGLLDSAEVFGTNPTNPTNADTDGDGLCDGGTGTPYMTSGHPTVTVNPICKSCSTPGLADCGTGGIRTGSADGIGDHPNPHGYGEDKNGNGAWDGSIGDKWTNGEPGSPETDPNQYDTDGDGDGDGVEVLSFSTSRQSWIPATDLFGRPITVIYPAPGSLEPLIADTDNDGLLDGYEDRNHDGNFDFLPSEFDHADPLPGPPIPYPTETNPCDPDTDHDGLSDYAERYQPNPAAAYPFNPTNPLDHDTDNDYIYDGPEVAYVCTEITHAELDNDGDGLIDEDPPDGLDNDGDGLIDEDGPDFTIRHVDVLDPTNRDSDSDGFIDGLDSDPCNSELIPVLQPVQMQPIDSDGDGFSDDDEIIAGTHPNDPNDHPTAYCKIDLDFDQEIDDRLWLEPSLCCGIANSVAIDIDSNVLVDARVQIVAPRDVTKGDFDGDGVKDDYRYVVEYSLANYRVVQPHVVLTIDDYNGDLVIDHAEVVRK